MIGSTLRKVAGSAFMDLGNGKITNQTVNNAIQAIAKVNSSLLPCESAYNNAIGLLSQVDPSNIQFYRAHVVYQTSLQYFGSTAIAALATSVLDVASNNHSGAVVQVNKSMTSLSNLFAAQRTAEGVGQWRGLFSMDRLPYAALQTSRRSVRQYQLRLLDPMAQNTDWAGGNPSGYYSFYDYQRYSIDNYPLQYPSQQYKANDFVLMSCTDDCENSPDGGVFSGEGTTIAMWSTRCRNDMDFDALSDCTQSGLVALYTTDGTVPTASSKIYEGPITINSTTTIIAVLQVNESLRNIVHNATFRKTISLGIP